MKPKYLNVDLKTSPHVTAAGDVKKIMLHVSLALTPVSAYSIYKYGLSALVILMVSVLSCLLTEHFISRVITYRKYGRAESSIGDFSAVITALLMGLTLPPGFPLWMTAVGGIVAMTFGKWAFGGLGFNLFNPALVGRVFLQAAFPVAITTWHPAYAADRFTKIIGSTLALPFMKPVWDGVSGATPLGLMKFEKQFVDSYTLFMGLADGAIGEGPIFLAVAGGLYLAIRKMLDWRIPVSILLTVVVVSQIFHWVDATQFPPVSLMLFAGGLMIAALFMATDMVTSPVTPLGVWLFGIFIGILVVVIRLFGGLQEVVGYAIVLGNAIVPILNRLTQPRVYGTGKQKYLQDKSV